MTRFWSQILWCWLPASERVILSKAMYCCSKSFWEDHAQHTYYHARCLTCSWNAHRAWCLNKPRPKNICRDNSTCMACSWTFQVLIPSVSVNVWNFELYLQENCHTIVNIFSVISKLISDQPTCFCYGSLWTWCMSVCDLDWNINRQWTHLNIVYSR